MNSSISSITCTYFHSICSLFLMYDSLEFVMSNILRRKTLFLNSQVCGFCSVISLRDTMCVCVCSDSSLVVCMVFFFFSMRASYKLIIWFLGFLWILPSVQLPATVFIQLFLVFLMYGSLELGKLNISRMKTLFCSAILQLRINKGFNFNCLFYFLITKIL